MNLNKKVSLMAICTLIADTKFTNEQEDVLLPVLEKYADQADKVAEEIENTSDEELFKEMISILVQCFEESENESK